MFRPTPLRVLAPAVAFAAATLSVLPAAATTSAGRSAPGQSVVLFTIGMHVEPFGATVSRLVPGTVGNAGAAGTAGAVGAAGSPTAQRPTYEDPVFFARHLADVGTFVSMVERHGGRMTVQLQSPFSTILARRGERLLPDLAARGHEIALHFHEDAHLGRAPERLPEAVWCAVMKEEVGLLKQAGASAVSYWSGGNLYPDVLSAGRCAGLSVNSDWKDPRTQTTPDVLVGLSPWRPSGGTDGTDFSVFARHDPAGPVVFLPEGLYSRNDFASMRRSEAAGGDAAYFDFLKGELERSVAGARTDRVNVFHLTVHPGEFRGAPGEEPFSVVESWLTRVVDPLVASGKVRWATFDGMKGAFADWERANPGVDPRSGIDPRPKISFVINVHDFTHLSESAATLHRLVDLFTRHGVKGDFYLTGPMVKLYEESHPDLLARLVETGMTVSYHVRAPHPLVTGFEAPLRGLDDPSLAAALRDYETYGLDLATGGLLGDEAGGYARATEVFGRPPVTVVAPIDDQRIKGAALRNYREMGASACVLYHETGTDPDEPFAYREGLLVRPSDFSVTRWKVGDVAEVAEDQFWWNMLGGRWGKDYVPLTYLTTRLEGWSGSRPPFVTSLIHENNFARRGPEGWTPVYYDGTGENRVPKAPPFDLGAKDPSTPRPEAEREAIFAAYEEMVAWAAREMQVVTSRDLVTMAMAAAMAYPAPSP